MKALFFLAVLAIVGLVVTGAIHLQRTSDNKLTIQVDESRAREDAQKVIDEGQDLLQKAETELQSASSTGNARN